MTDADQSLMLEILKRLQADMADVKQRLTGVEIQLSAMGQQLGGLTSAIYGNTSDLNLSLIHI